MEGRKQTGSAGGARSVVLLLLGTALVILGTILFLARFRSTSSNEEQASYLISPVGIVHQPVHEFVWRRLEGATGHRFDLIDPDSGLLLQQTLPDTVLVLPDEIRLAPRMTYLWRVTYDFPDGVSQPTNEEAFRIEMRRSSTP